MLVIPQSVVTITDPHILVTEASTAGLPPGKWPTEIMVKGDVQLHFGPRHTISQDADGDLIVIIYHSTDGSSELHILND